MKLLGFEKNISSAATLSNLTKGKKQLGVAKKRVLYEFDYNGLTYRCEGIRSQEYPLYGSWDHKKEDRDSHSTTAVLKLEVLAKGQLPEDDQWCQVDYDPREIPGSQKPINHELRGTGPEIRGAYHFNGRTAYPEHSRV